MTRELRTPPKEFPDTVKTMSDTGLAWLLRIMSLHPENANYVAVISAEIAARKNNATHTP